MRKKQGKGAHAGLRSLPEGREASRSFSVCLTSLGGSVCVSDGCLCPSCPAPKGRGRAGSRPAAGPSGAGETGKLAVESLGQPRQTVPTSVLPAFVSLIPDGLSITYSVQGASLILIANPQKALEMVHPSDKETKKQSVKNWPASQGPYLSGCISHGDLPRSAASMLPMTLPR